MLREANIRVKSNKTGCTLRHRKHLFLAKNLATLFVYLMLFRTFMESYVSEGTTFHANNFKSINRVFALILLTNISESKNPIEGIAKDVNV